MQGARWGGGEGRAEVLRGRIGSWRYGLHREEIVFMQEAIDMNVSHNNRRNETNGFEVIQADTKKYDVLKKNAEVRKNIDGRKDNGRCLFIGRPPRVIFPLRAGSSSRFQPASVSFLCV